MKPDVVTLTILPDGMWNIAEPVGPSGVRHTVILTKQEAEELCGLLMAEIAKRHVCPKCHGTMEEVRGEYNVERKCKKCNIGFSSG